MKITKLDLGDTLHGNGVSLKPGWVSIALDQTDKLVGDWNHMPFLDNVFKHAYGAFCLDESVVDEFDPTELHRVLRPGGTTQLGNVCGNVESKEAAWKMLAKQLERLKSAGFTIQKSCQLYFDWQGSYWWFSQNSHIHIQKERTQ